MNNSSRLLMILIIFVFLSLIILGFQKVKALEPGSDSKQPMMQNQGSTETPTIINTPPNQTEITPTSLITATLAVEPFPSITLIFPELSSSTTPTASITKDPDKAIPLSRISSNNNPTGKSGLVYAVIILWVILVIFAFLIARKAYALWFE